MYHPLYSDGTYETNRGAYEYVEWDELDDDVLTEADRCYSLLKAEVSRPSRTSSLDSIMGGNPVDSIPTIRV